MRDTAALARKDLLLELRAKETLPSMLLFVIAALTIFHFALPSGTSDVAARGLLWAALIFTALLGLTRAFVAEREQSMFDALILTPVDRSAIWLGKAITAIVLPSQIALRSTGVRTSASNMLCSRSATKARVSPSSAVKTIADQRSPSAALSPVPRGSAKWKIVSVAITNRSIDGRVSFARSSSSRSFRVSAATSER